MNTIKRIEEIIRKREDLARRVDRANNCLTTSADRTVHPVGCNTDIVRIPDSLIRPIIQKQVEMLQLELAAIDKQLEAIGALMGVQNA